MQWEGCVLVLFLFLQLLSSEYSKVKELVAIVVDKRKRWKCGWWELNSGARAGGISVTLWRARPVHNAHCTLHIAHCTLHNKWFWLHNIDLPTTHVPHNKLWCCTICRSFSSSAVFPTLSEKSYNAVGWRLGQAREAMLRWQPSMSVSFQGIIFVFLCVYRILPALTSYSQHWYSSSTEYICRRFCGAISTMSVITCSSIC